VAGPSNPQLTRRLPDQLTPVGEPLEPVPHGRDACSLHLHDREDDCFARLDRTGITRGRQQAQPGGLLELAARPLGEPQRLGELDAEVVRAALLPRGAEPERRVDLLTRLAGPVHPDVSLAFGSKRDQLTLAVDRHAGLNLDLRPRVLNAHLQPARHAATVQRGVVHARHGQMELFPVLEMVATRVRAFGGRRIEILAALDLLR
jgi:hypothetical protein